MLTRRARMSLLMGFPRLNQLQGQDMSSLLPLPPSPIPRAGSQEEEGHECDDDNNEEHQDHHHGNNRCTIIRSRSHDGNRYGGGGGTQTHMHVQRCTVQ